MNYYKIRYKLFLGEKIKGKKRKAVKCETIFFTNESGNIGRNCARKMVERLHGEDRKIISIKQIKQEDIEPFKSYKEGR